MSPRPRRPVAYVSASFRIPKPLYERVGEEATRRVVGRGLLVERALAQWLDANAGTYDAMLGDQSAVAIVEALAATAEPWTEGVGGIPRCELCEAKGALAEGFSAPHDPTCPWMRARAWKAARGT